MDNVIAMTLYRRHAYARRVLEALAACRGVERYHVLLHVEPGFEEVIELARGFALPHKTVVTNPRRLGCAANTFAALDHGFSLADFVVLLEDDTVPAADMLRWFEFCRGRFAGDADLFTVGGYSKGAVPPERYYTFRRNRWFTPWGWATWRDRFEEMGASWGFRSRSSWDVVLNEKVRGGRSEVLPWLARVQNIGAVGGTYCPGPQWHRENQYNEFWAGSVEIDPAPEFRPEDGTE